MSYQDELDELDEEIRHEILRQKTTNTAQTQEFSSPAELLSLLKSASVRTTIRTLTFCACIRRLRTRVGVSPEAFATALDIAPEVLDQLESNESMPWIQPPSVIADVAYGLRLHINAIENLTQNSFRIASASGRISDSALTTQLISSWLAEVRLKLKTRGADDLVD